MNNWKITNGKYNNYNFIIAGDTYVAQKLSMSRASITNYKKTLKSLGLIAILPKFTTRTNRSKNYHHRQIMVVLKSMPRKLISNSLTILKGAKILKIYSSIISRFFKNLNRGIHNLHANLKNLLITAKSKNNTKAKEVQAIIELFKNYNVKYKQYELKQYIKLYINNKDRFIATCKICSNRYLYAPLNYFITVYNNPTKTSNYKYNTINYKNHFNNFPQRKYDYNKLEKLLLRNNTIQ